MNLMFSAIIPLLGIIVIFFFGKRGILFSSAIFIAIATLCFLFSTAVLLQTSSLESVHFWQGFFVSDSTSRLFIALISSVLLGSVLYVHNRAMQNHFELAKFHQLISGTFLFFSISVLSILSNHMLLMWIFLEASSLALTPLIYFNKDKFSLQAAWKYFLFSTIALGMVFLGLLCLSKSMIFQVTGNAEASFFFHELALRVEMLGKWPWRDLGLILIFLGLGTKLGLAPMYNWLPEAYDRSPQLITVMLASVQFNVVMVMIFRIMQYLAPLQSPIIRYMLISLGLISILISVFHILVEKSYKKLIAYASINHAGVIAIGLGLSLGKDSAYGVLIYVISNALVKAILFLACGNIHVVYKTRAVSEIKLLIKTIPVSGWSFLIGIFALLGFAPFGSFFGELFIMKSMIDGNYYAVFALFCLMMTVVFVAMGRTAFPMIWGKPKEELAPHQESLFMLLPIIFFTILLLSMGIYLPASANDLLQNIAVSIGGAR